jgi:2-polyprenyl-3-methyl-5-hydroxy-6-metoxy-1,4-benzoquinol methylase
VSSVISKDQLVIPENTSKNTHNVVAELVGDVADGKVVLDLPCGEGAFTKRMLESGANVFSADFLNILRIPHGQFSVVDMNQRLPYADAMFDAVVCIDGIEHIERPFDFIRECQRIIRKGGVLIISTPNLSALRSRWRYLLTGFHQGEKSPLDESEYTPLHHLSLVSFPELRYRLHANGFKVAAVRTNRVKFISWLYAVLAPLAYVVTVLAFNKEEKVTRVREQNREIVNQMFTIPVLFGETLIVKATRI